MLKRSLKSGQIGLRTLAFIVSGVPATPTVTGYDQYQIDSIVDNGVGHYTIIFEKPFTRACQCLGIGMITTGTIGEIFAVDYDRITIKTWDAATGAAATDANFYLNVVGSDNRYDV